MADLRDAAYAPLRDYLYSPSCREQVFSETLIQLREFLCVRTGTKRRFAHPYTWRTTQDVAGLDRYAEVA